MALSIENLTCPLCKELATDAVESSCCHQIFCEECIKQLKNWSACPLCRARNTKYYVNVLGRRLCNSVKLPCQHCQRMIARSDLEKHEENCEQCPRRCGAHGCSFKSGDRRKGFSHLAAAHGDALWEDFEEMSKASPFWFIPMIESSLLFILMSNFWAKINSLKYLHLFMFSSHWRSWSCVCIVSRVKKRNQVAECDMCRFAKFKKAAKRRNQGIAFRKLKT